MKIISLDDLLFKDLFFNQTFFLTIFYPLINMSNTTINAETTNIIREPINDDYEWLQYNKELRLIHSIKDDMYQMKSIIKACKSNKSPKNWFENKSTQELLEEFDKEFSKSGIPPLAKSYEKRDDLPNGLRGVYVHRLLVNHIAMWASPKYSIKVLKLLDEIYKNERNEIENKLNETTEKINEQKPRLVPKKKSKNYVYMIWIENDKDDENKRILHLVKRNKRTFRQVSEIKKDKNKCWFYRDELPIAMTPNEEIKDWIRKTIKGESYKIKSSKIIIDKDYLNGLHQYIEFYFDNFQE